MKNLFNSKRKVKILTVVMFLCVNLTIYPQQLDIDKVTLTKKERYKDFDYFCNIIAKVNPQLEARQNVTGVDIMKNIKTLRREIDTITNDTSYMQLLLRAIHIINDMHCIPIKGELLAKVLKDTALASNVTEMLDYAESSFYKNKRRVNIRLYYTGGKYYNICQYNVIQNNKTDSLPLGAEIISVNGKSVDYWIENNIINVGLGMNWDTHLNRSFTMVRVLWVDKSDFVNIKYSDKNRIDSIVYPTKGRIGFSLNGGDTFFFDAREEGYVEYFDDTKVLYVRLPQMLAERYSYVDSIIAKGTGKPIDKVVIDIRNNPGGIDDVWMNILGAITKDTIFINSRMALRHTIEARNIMQKSENISDDKWDSLFSKPTKLPLLGNKKFILTDWGNPIVPHKNSIGYNGNIYVLQNRMIFSSAGSLSNAAYLNDKIVSVGQTTGKLLGFGVAPRVITLPYSHFTFLLECLMEVNGGEQTSYDYYHDNVEIPVEISAEQMVEYDVKALRNDLSPIKYIFTKDFLYNSDPVFQKVLEHSHR